MKRRGQIQAGPGLFGDISRQPARLSAGARNYRQFIDGGGSRARRRRGLTIQESFEAWLRLNPKILDLFLRYAREARGAGMKSYGIGAITERVRWHVRVETRGDDFKINNNWRSRLARLLIRTDPTLADFFETRRLRA